MSDWSPTEWSAFVQAVGIVVLVAVMYFFARRMEDTLAELRQQTETAREQAKAAGDMAQAMIAVQQPVLYVVFTDEAEQSWRHVTVRDNGHAAIHEGSSAAWPDYMRNQPKVRSLRIKNIGHGPAVNVEMDAWLWDEALQSSALQTVRVAVIRAGEDYGPLVVDLREDELKVACADAVGTRLEFARALTWYSQESGGTEYDVVALDGLHMQHVNGERAAR